MKLKKFLALGLALVMMLGLVACGGKEEAKDPTENNPSVTEPSTTEPTVNVEEMKAYYEKYFESADFGFAGDSIKAVADGVEVMIAKAKDNTCLFRMGIGETLFEIYVDENGQQYAHLKTPATEDEEALDAWYLYNNENAEEDEKDMFASMSSDVDMEDFTINKEAIVKVEYIETDEDGFDHVKVSSKNPEYDPEMKSTSYKIKFTYEGQECTMTVVHSEGNGMSSNMFVDKENVPETFSTMDYDIDFENNKWIAEDEDAENIDFEVIASEETTVPEYVDVEILVVAETHKIAKMTQTLNGMETVVEFGNPLSCKQEVTIPETVEECDAETLAMLYLAVLFSAMGSM